MARWKGFRQKADKCYYCRVSVQELKDCGIPMTVDHILPKCKGGTNDEDNLVTACERCNNMKSDSLEWYEGCVAIEAFGNPEWFRDMIFGEEEAKKTEQGTKKNGKNVVRDPEEGKEWWKQSVDWSGPF